MRSLYVYNTGIVEKVLIKDFNCFILNNGKRVEKPYYIHTHYQISPASKYRMLNRHTGGSFLPDVS